MLHIERSGYRAQRRIIVIDYYDARKLRDEVSSQRFSHPFRHGSKILGILTVEPVGCYDQIPNIRRVLAKKQGEQLEGPLLLRDVALQRLQFFGDLSHNFLKMARAAAI